MLTPVTNIHNTKCLYNRISTRWMACSLPQHHVVYYHRSPMLTFMHSSSSRAQLSCTNKQTQTMRFFSWSQTIGRNVCFIQHCYAFDILNIGNLLASAGRQIPNFLIQCNKRPIWVVKTKTAKMASDFHLAPYMKRRVRIWCGIGKPKKKLTKKATFFSGFWSELPQITQPCTAVHP